MRLHRTLALSIVIVFVAAACGTAGPSEPDATVEPTASVSPSATPAPTLAPTPTPTLAPTMAPTPTLAPTVAPSPTPGALGVKLACKVLTAKVAVAIVGKGTPRNTLDAVYNDDPTGHTRQSRCGWEVQTAPLTGMNVNLVMWGALDQLGRVGIQNGFDYFTKDGGEVIPDLGSKAFFTTDVRAIWVISDDGAYLLQVRYGKSSKAECLKAAKAILANL